jgi:transcriptional regulator EpsA
MAAFPVEEEILIKTRADLDVLLVNLEAGIKVKSRPDFFSWVQGVFQGVLGHEIMICAIAEGFGRGYRADVMSSLPMEEERIAALCERGGGFVYRVMALWEQLGRKAVYLHSRGRLGSADFGLGQDIERLQLENVIAHGIPDTEGRACAFFVFAKLRQPVAERQMIGLEVMIPQLYHAWVKVCCDEGRRQFPPLPLPSEILTGREVEILNLVEQGKSNNEIARILEISHLTVKNHVQKILRKLKVQNRAQAVAKGISLNLTSGR